MTFISLNLIPSFLTCGFGVVSGAVDGETGTTRDGSWWDVLTTREGFMTSRCEGGIQTGCKGLCSSPTLNVGPGAGCVLLLGVGRLRAK